MVTFEFKISSTSKASLFPFISKFINFVKILFFFADFIINTLIDSNQMDPIIKKVYNKTLFENPIHI